MASGNAAWGHGTYKQGSWKHGPWGTLDRCWTQCACGAWVWDGDKPPACVRCGRPFGEGEAVQTRASGVHRSATAEEAEPEDGRHSSFLEVLQAAGGQLGVDLHSMAVPWLVNKATPEQQESSGLQELTGLRIAASKAKAIRARTDKQVAKIERELREALVDQEAAKQACAKAEDEMEQALAKYQSGQGDDRVPHGVQEAGEAGGEEADFDAQQEAAAWLHGEEEQAMGGLRDGVQQ